MQSICQSQFSNSCKTHLTNKIKIFDLTSFRRLHYHEDFQSDSNNKILDLSFVDLPPSIWFDNVACDSVVPCGIIQAELWFKQALNCFIEIKPLLKKCKVDNTAFVLCFRQLKLQQHFCITFFCKSYECDVKKFYNFHFLNYSESSFFLENIFANINWKK